MGHSSTPRTLTLPPGHESLIGLWGNPSRDLA